MRRVIDIFLVVLLAGVSFGELRAQGDLQRQLEQVYGKWRAAMIGKSSAGWQAHTSSRRQVEVRNRILSERFPFPAAVFDLPAAPPSLAGLKAMQASSKGATAKAVYYGRVDFGVGGDLPDNLLVLSFVNERGGWKYDGAEFINLAAMPDLRKKLSAGEAGALESPEFLPVGRPEPLPIQLPGPVKYIAKAYVYCPGREVRLQINKISRHAFANTKDAEVVIGGARDGANEVQFAIKRLPGAEGNEPMTVRVYLMSEVRGVDPLKAFEYQVGEGEVPKAVGTLNFAVTPEMAARLQGR